jgi:hypothetical protein
MFQKRLMKIFGPKWDEIIGDRRKLLTEEFYKFQSSPKIKKDEKDRSCSTRGSEG